MINNEGYQIEEAMRKWFHGKAHADDCVDFQTKTSLYEVKSCNLFNICNNGNDKRHYATKPHKKIITNQLGRFHIYNHNHILINEAAKKENKIAKYIFVIKINNQKIWRVWPLELVNIFIRKNKDVTPIRIKDIFGGKIL